MHYTIYSIHTLPSITIIDETDIDIEVVDLEAEARLEPRRLLLLISLISIACSIKSITL